MKKKSTSSILFLVSYELGKKIAGGKYYVALTVVAVGRDLFHALSNYFALVRCILSDEHTKAAH